MTPTKETMEERFDKKFDTGQAFPELICITENGLDDIKSFIRQELLAQLERIEKALKNELKEAEEANGHASVFIDMIGEGMYEVFTSEKTRLIKSL